MKVVNINPDHSENKTHRSGKQSRGPIKKATTRITDFFKKKEKKEDKQERTASKQKSKAQNKKVKPDKERQERNRKKGDNDKRNDYQEEEEWWGDKMEQKQDGTVRIFYQNTNGIKYDRLGGEVGWYGHYMVENEIDILGIAEHNVDNRSAAVILTIRQALERVEKSFAVTMGGTKTKMDTPYKPGGTMIVARGNIRGRIMERGSDSLGRWTYLRIRGKQGRSLWVLTVYQVCKSSPTAGMTASAQQLSLLRQNGDTATPREAFKRDLMNFINDTINPDDETVIMGDFNEEIGADSEGIVRFMEEGGLADLMTATHQKDLPATFERGKACIDYVLATPKILQAIVNAGYTPQSGGLYSDHRGLFMDIDINNILGGALPQIPTPTRRTFEASSPALVTKYLEAATEALATRNVTERARRLMEKDTPDHKQAEAIDNDITRMLLSAASKIRRYRPPPWVEELHHTRRQVRLWKGHLKAHRKGITPAKTLQILHDSVPKDQTFPKTVPECQTLLRAAQKKVRIIVRDAVRHRREELERRAQEHATSNNCDGKNKAKIIRNIRKREELKEMFKKLRRMRGTDRHTGITTVKVPTDPKVDPKQCTEWKEVDTPEEVETAIRERNRLHFGQADGTPFATPKMKEQLDFMASTKTAELILDGQYEPDDVTSAAAALADHLRKAPVPEIAAELSEAAFRGKLKTWPEKTTTSPSGLHLGHWKALVLPHTHSHGEHKTKEARERAAELDAMQEELFTLRLQMLNYATRWGYSYRRWQEVVNTMILKKEGDTRIHRLRVIHLYEADYNLLLAVKWREALHAAEEAGTIHEGQYGSRPYRQALDPVYLEEMMNEIGRATSKPYIKFDNDASSCYDRILPQLASIASRQQGIPESIAKLNTSTLREARYRLRTALGVSKEHYTHTDDKPIYGTGQGSGNSPIIWCFLSSALFTAHAERAHGAIFTTPTYDHFTKIGMIGFVDDSTGQVNDFMADKPPDQVTLMEKMQHDAQLWYDLLRASGGELELSKCSFHNVRWGFTSKGSSFPDPERDEEATITVRRQDDTHDGTNIQQLEPTQSHKTLGHWKEPAGRQKDQREQLQRKSAKLATTAHNSPMTRKDAWVFYFAIFLPSITYPLANSFFERAVLERIVHPATKRIAAKCGFARSTPSAVLYGPAGLGGAAFRQGYSEQGIGQLQLFLRHWRQPETQAGRLSRIAVHWTQFHCGTSKSFLEDVRTKHPHTSSKWHASLRAFLNHSGTTLLLDDKGVLPIQRQYDTHIMDRILASGMYKEDEIRFINNCRLYLQATTIADLAHPDGETLDLAMLEGKPSLQSSISNLVLVHQERPVESAWELWRKCNLLWSEESGKLYTPLGDWLCTTAEMRRSWRAYWDRTESTCYVRTDQTHPYEATIYTIGQNNVLTAPTIETVDEIPLEAIPVELEPIGTTWRMKPHTIAMQQETHQHMQATTLDEYIRQGPRSIAALFPNGGITTHSRTNLLQHPTLIAATDGGVNGLAGMGWLIATNDGKILTEGFGPVCGRDVTSYRAELHGILAVITYLQKAETYYGLPIPPVTLYCDNKAAIEQTAKIHKAAGSTSILRGLVNPLTADYDVLHEIAVTFEAWTTPISMQHIEAHQDAKKPEHELTVPARLNIRADKLATKAIEQAQPDRTPSMFPHAGAMLVSAKGPITRKLPQTIRYDIGAEMLLERLRTKYEWTARTEGQIDWDIHRALIKRHSKRRVQVVKLVHNLVPTNVVRHRYGTITSPTCPLCQIHPETVHHMARCKHGTRKEWRSRAKNAMVKAAKKSGASMDAVEALVGGWIEWLTTGSIPDASTLSPNIQAAMISQTEIGWGQIIHGRISKEWATLRSAKTTGEPPETKRINPPSLWVLDTMDALWKAWFELWKERNDFVHGKTKQEQTHKQRLTAEAQIRDIYSKKAEYLPSDRTLLTGTVESFLENKSLTTLTNWLTVWKPVFERSAARSLALSIRGVPSITTFFKPPAPL